MIDISSFSIGNVLSQSVDLFKRQGLTFSIVAIALLAVPNILLMAFVMPGAMSSGSMLLVQLPAIVQLVFQLILMGALSYGTYAAIDGKPASIQELIARGVSGALPLFGIIVIFILVMIGSVFLLFIPIIFISCMWWVAVPVLVVEKAGVIGSLKRSTYLTKGARMKIFGLLVIYLLFSIVVTAISLTLLVGGGFSLTSITSASAAIMQGGVSAYLVVSNILGAIIFAFVCVVVAVCYAELRRIKEGVSVKDVAQIFS
jgi:hypothetical protein